MSRPEILGIPFDLIGYDDVLSAIRGWRDRHERRYITITNPHSVLMCHRDPAMKAATTGAALTLPDGVGIMWACAILGYPHRGRVSGPALMLRLCDQGQALGLRHYFYGGADGVADMLAQRMRNRFPGIQIAGTYCPPFRTVTDEEDAGIVRRINGARPDIVWVGLGAPKQEIWVAAHAGAIDAPAVIGVGAAFDFHSGAVKWAPGWVRRCGLEWAYRLAQNPRRMWRRNVDSPRFLIKVLAQRLARKTNAP